MINVYVIKSFMLIGELLNPSAEIIVSIFLLIILLKANVKITFVIFFVLFSLSLFFKWFISPMLREVGKQSNDAYVGMVSSVSQAVNGIKEVKMFGCEEFFLDTYEVSAKSNVSLENKKDMYSFIPRRITEFIAVCMMLLLIFVSSSPFQVDASQIVSQTALFSFVLLRMLPGMIKINSYLNQIAYYTPSLLSIDEEVTSYMMSEEDEHYQEEEPWKLKNSIKICNVFFI